MKVAIIDGTEIHSGKVEIRGFKHSFVSVLAACIACRDIIKIKNAPYIAETEVLQQILEQRGGRVSLSDSYSTFDCSDLSGFEIDPLLSSKIHGSLYLIPAFLAATGGAIFSESGGCLIGDGSNGERPVLHMLKVCSIFGATFCYEADRIEGRVGRIKTATLDIMNFSDSSNILTGPLVSGATKTALITALGAPAEQLSEIRTPYYKPDVLDILRFAESKGAFVDASPDRILVSSPPRSLAMDKDNLSFTLTPDLSEIITCIALGVMAGITITMKAEDMKRAKEGLHAEFLILDKMNVQINYINDDTIVVVPPEHVTGVDIEVTSVGIYSDHQPFFALMLTKGDRPSLIRERVWKKRFDYLTVIEAFGGDLERLESGVLIRPSVLRQPRAPVIARDLRMAAVALVASLSVRHPCTIVGLDHLRRGYSNIHNWLTTLGAAYRGFDNLS